MELETLLKQHKKRPLEFFQYKYSDIKFDDCLQDGEVNNIGRGLMYDFYSLGYMELDTYLDAGSKKRIEDAVNNEDDFYFSTSPTGLQLLEQMDTTSALNDDNVLELESVVEQINNPNLNIDTFYVFVKDRVLGENMPETWELDTLDAYNTSELEETLASVPKL